MARIGLVLGAGGIVGAAFHEGVLRAIADATGWDAATAEIIVGTSAGSHVGAVLRAGATASDVRPDVRRRNAGGVTARRSGSSAPTPPRRGPAAPGLFVRGLTRPGGTRVVTMFTGLIPEGRVSMQGFAAGVNRLHPGGWPDAPLWLPAVRLSDGQRVVFGRAGAPETDVGSAVAASCAIPGYFAPTVIDGERYVDGGVHSTTNLDLLAGEDLDLVVVCAPMGAARGVRHPRAALQGRGAMRLRLGLEARAVRRRGTPVVAFSPTAADLEVMGWNAMAHSRRSAVIERAYASATRRLEDPRWQAELEPLAA